MSLIRSRWVGLAAVFGLVMATLWWFLQPTKTDDQAPLPIGRVDTDYISPAPIDLAVSSGLFADVEAEALNNSSQELGNVATASQSPPRLVGLATHRGSAVALAVDQSGQTRLLRAGEAIDGWTLASVTRDQAVFAQGDRRERATLDFKNKADGATSTPTQQLIDTAIKGEGSSGP